MGVALDLLLPVTIQGRRLVVGASDGTGSSFGRLRRRRERRKEGAGEAFGDDPFGIQALRS